MRLEELELFRRAAVLGSLSAAGRELGLSPAAASARLQSLENSVGATLFNRTTRSLSLTEEGETMLLHAGRALEELETAKTLVSGVETKPSGTLRASLPGPFGQKHILPFLKEFRDRYPEVELDLHVSDVIVNVVEGGYDVVVRVAPLADSALKVTKLADNRRVIVASPEYLKGHPVPVEPEDLRDHDALVHGELRTWRFLRDGEERSVRVSGPLHAYDGAITRDAALYGFGIAMKSIFDVGEDLKEGRLVELLPDWTMIGAGSIWALRPPGRFTPPRVRAFIDFLKEKYSPKPYWEID
ncbi:MAG: LysR family transcriptional regulator [Pseudomonadota bacterium]